MSFRSRLLLPLFLFSGMMISLLVLASDTAEEDSNKLQPNLQLPANATACVEPTDIMRRNHMDFLLHQRDATVIDGIRTEKHSLTGCIDCHNAGTEAQAPVHYEDPQHFCASCHNFSAVKIDCFECHADRPVPAS